MKIILRLIIGIKLFYLWLVGINNLLILVQLKLGAFGLAS